MFDWVEEIVPQNGIHELKVPESIQIEEITTNQRDSMSYLGQFFAAPSALMAENNMVQLRVSNEYTKSVLLSEVMPHFRNTKAVYQNGKVITFIMQYLKENSATIFNRYTQNGLLFPILPDLYRNTKTNFGPEISGRTLRHFAVKTNEIEKINLPYTDDFRRFIIQTFFEPGEGLTLCPTGWEFDDDIRESITVGFFATFASSIRLMVDSSTHIIIAIDIN
ncbi:hypothetical protein AB6A23_08410 [Paenibacillus tarimensis]